MEGRRLPGLMSPAHIPSVCDTRALHRVCFRISRDSVRDAHGMAKVGNCYFETFVKGETAQNNVFRLDSVLKRGGQPVPQGRVSISIPMA